MSRSDYLLVGDVLDAMRAVCAWTSGVTRDAFLADEMRISAIEWQLLVMGEAAKQLPSELRDANPGIDWRGMIRLRDFLAHGYASVAPDELRQIATDEIPRDLAPVDALLAGFDPNK